MDNNHISESVSSVRSMQRDVRILLGVRLTIYSFLETKELLKKISKLCTIDREQIRDSKINFPNRCYYINIIECNVDLMKKLTATQTYLMKMISEIRIQVRLTDTLDVKKSECLA